MSEVKAEQQIRKDNANWEHITNERPKWESEEFVVVMKQGNAWGAKGLYYKRVSN